jgi:hypothetical protein
MMSIATDHAVPVVSSLEPCDTAHREAVMSGCHHAPLPPPVWATRTVEEDEGITYERVSGMRPPVAPRWPPVDAEAGRPTDVSVAVVDRLEAGRWTRSAPTVQIEGGCYSLRAAKQLRRAIDDLIAALECPDDTNE